MNEKLFAFTKLKKKLFIFLRNFLGNFDNHNSHKNYSKSGSKLQAGKPSSIATKPSLAYCSLNFRLIYYRVESLTFTIFFRFGNEEIPGKRLWNILKIIRRLSKFYQISKIFDTSNAKKPNYFTNSANISLTNDIRRNY